MKFILAIAFIVACIGCEVYAQEKQCKGVVGLITREQRQQLQNGDFLDGNAPTEVMCYIKCLLEEVDALDGDALYADVFLDKFSSHLGENPKALFDLCNDEVGEGECETTFKIMMCLRRNKDKYNS